MAGFAEAALERVRVARARLAAAQEADDAVEEAQAAEAVEVAAAIVHAGEHGMQVFVRPCTHPLQEPESGKGAES